MSYRRSVLTVILSLTLVTAVACGSEAPPPVPSGPAPEAMRPGSIPISAAGSLGQYNLSSANYAIARRFVLPADLTIDRWYYAVNVEGADCIGGRDGYGHGSGGIEYGRIVEVDQATGLPTDTVLGGEQVNGCDAHERVGEEFGLSETHQVHYVQFAPISLLADRMYAFVLSNVDSDPGNGDGSDNGNYTSANLNFAALEDVGPNGRNNLDPAAPGATSGLDPRETVMWSADAGASWKFGDQVGWYSVGNGEARMWPGGYRIAGGPNVPDGWVYMNWPDEGQGRITFNATGDGVLTMAGGASSEGDVGVIRVENLDTGESATTESLGTGLMIGKLSQPVPVATGQRYVVSTDGDVDVGSGAFWDRVFDFGAEGPGGYEGSCSDCAAPTDRPMLYAS